MSTFVIFQRLYVKGKTGKTTCKTPLPCHFFMLENTCTPGESYVIYPVSILMGHVYQLCYFYFCSL